MSKVEEVLTPEEILHYAELDTVIGRMCDGYNRADTHYTDPDEFVDQIGFRNFNEIRSDYTTAHFMASLTITRHQKNGIKFGIVQYFFGCQHFFNTAHEIVPPFPIVSRIT